MNDLVCFHLFIICLEFLFAECSSFFWTSLAAYMCLQCFTGRHHNVFLTCWIKAGPHWKTCKSSAAFSNVRDHTQWLKKENEIIKEKTNHSFDSFAPGVCGVQWYNPDITPPTKGFPFTVAILNKKKEKKTLKCNFTVNKRESHHDVTSFAKM